MIDNNEATRLFKEKFDKMTPQEREKYLEGMGFVFAEKKSEGTLPKQDNIRNYAMNSIVLKHGGQLMVASNKNKSRAVDAIELEKMINHVQGTVRYMGKPKPKSVTLLAKKRG